MTNPPRRRFLTPTAWLVGGCVAIIGAVFTAQLMKAETLAATERINGVAETTVVAIESEFAVAIQTLIGATALMEAGPGITNETFSHYIEESTRPPGFVAWGIIDTSNHRAVVSHFAAPGFDTDWLGVDLADKRDTRGVIAASTATRSPMASSFQWLTGLPARSAMVVITDEHGHTAFTVVNAGLLENGLPGTLTSQVRVTMTQSTQLAAPGDRAVSRSVGFANQQWSVTLTPVSGRLVPSGYVVPSGIALTLVIMLLGMILTGTGAQRRRLRSDIHEQNRINEAREQFIASVSHEIRTPLTAVVGYAQLVRDAWDDLSDAERRDMVSQISEQSVEVNSLVADLLVGSRADISSLHLDIAPVTLRGVVERALASIPSDLRRDVTVHFGDDRAWLADGGRAAQIVRNLIVNALKYGGPHVSVESRRLPGMFVLSVVDDGSGIDPAVAATIFEPFVSIGMTNQALPSVGLGLFVCTSLAKAMGGSVVYRRSAGLTSFDVALPAAPSEEPISSFGGLAVTEAL